jgi:hypothetical protein
MDVTCSKLPRGWHFPTSSAMGRWCRVPEKDNDSLNPQKKVIKVIEKIFSGYGTGEEHYLCAKSG